MSRSPLILLQLAKNRPTRGYAGKAGLRSCVAIYISTFVLLQIMIFVPLTSNPCVPASNYMPANLCRTSVCQPCLLSAVPIQYHHYALFLLLLRQPAKFCSERLLIEANWPRGILFPLCLTDHHGWLAKPIAPSPTR